MKIRSNAFLSKHFRDMFFIFSLFCGMHNFVLSNPIVTQFRAPLSLGELLHEGLLLLQEDIEQMGVSKEYEGSDMLTKSLQKIDDLHSLYDLRNSKSGLNEIHTDERDFLQGLIDRIDQMIQKLEGSSSESNSDLIRKNIDSLHELRNVLEN
ncbi:hypothetical protein HYV10_02310 [Candidatus Dependentiae bacterium]|nr:hypothetical protein [Candidatus Dependentiae bacterium]